MNPFDPTLNIESYLDGSTMMQCYRGFALAMLVRKKRTEAGAR